MSFVHLHSHSHYSLLDGLPKIDDMIARAQEIGSNALALTDHGVMYGAVEFYQKAKKAGIKPIIGFEGYLAPNSRKDKKQGEKPFHQILYARDLIGYKNLMRISSAAHLEGFYYKPRFDIEVLEKYSKGIIATSSCLQGIIPQHLKNGDEQKAVELVSVFQKIFGAENFYLEVQPHPEIPEQVTLNEQLFALARELSMPIIATNDSHYINKDDAEAQDILVCVQTGKTVQDTNRLKMTGVDLSMKSEEEMRAQFPDNPEVMDETVRLADRCDVELELGSFHFPAFELPEGKNADEYLSELTRKGLKEKFGSAAPEGYAERIEYELGIVKTKGYATYFLIVADFGNWARGNGIVATVRGSAAGSLVSYLIGITTVDPMTYHLPFERFLNPYRPSAPDIDMDFADNRRSEVLQYVRDTYGEDKVAQICTFGTMLARGAVRDVGRALGYPYAFCDRIAKLIPTGRQGFPMTIDRALKESEDLKAIYQSEADAKRLLDVAQKIEGCARHPSVHAAGVVISPTELTDFTPLQKETGGDNIITQYEMHAVEEAGLVKMDFLGIRNLSILGNAVRLVKKTKGVIVDIGDIPLDDPKTFTLLAKGQTMGMFQLGGGGMTRYLVELKPTKITDIMAMVALFRPGPMESIPEFIARKNDPSKVTYLDPRMEKFLKDSYGIITYQDDILYISIEIAGYNWEEADKLRKAMGKKIPEEMAAQKDKFIKGCVDHGKLEIGTAQHLWELIEPFAAYGFGRAHAASYGIVAYQTAYMKAHYPAEFMAALMSAESDDIEKVAEAVNECRSMGMQVLPPDVNESFADFTVVDDVTIRFGLSAIKNVGRHIIDVIIEERKQNGPYGGVPNFLERVADKDLNKKSIESFIKSGALDSLGERHTLFANVDRLLAFAKDSHEAAARNQGNLFGESEKSEQALQLVPAAPDGDEQLAWEKELLGLYISGHPLEKYRAMLEAGPYQISKITSAGGKVTIFTLLKTIKQISTKKGDLMAFLSLEDLSGHIEAIMFPKTYKQHREMIEENQLVAVQGKVEERNNTMQIIVEKVRPLTADSMNAVMNQSNPIENQAPAEQLGTNETFDATQIEIHVEKGMDKKLFDELKEILYNAQGIIPVTIHINGSKKIRLPHGVNPTHELKQKLVSLLGEARIHIR